MYIFNYVGNNYSRKYFELQRWFDIPDNSYSSVNIVLILS